MDWIRPIALIAAGILAASGFIISKHQNARHLIDRLVPFQGFIGVGLLGWGVFDLIDVLRHRAALGRIGDVYPLFMVSMYAAVASAILLGFLLGMPLLARWIPGDSAAEVRAMNAQKKLAAWNTLLGFVGIGAAVMLVYYNFKF